MNPALNPNTRGSHAIYKLEDTPAPPILASLLFFFFDLFILFFCWTSWLKKGISSNLPFQRHSQLTLLISMLLFLLSLPLPIPLLSNFFRAWKRAPNKAAWMKWIVIPAKPLLAVRFPLSVSARPHCALTLCGINASGSPDYPLPPSPIHLLQHSLYHSCGSLSSSKMYFKRAIKAARWASAGSFS